VRWYFGLIKPVKDRKRESEVFLPHAPENNIRVISNFRKFVEIFASEGAPPVSTTPAANFATSTAGVVNTGGKIATGVTIPATNLPPVSTYVENTQEYFVIMQNTSIHVKLSLSVSQLIFDKKPK
jgi:uncharacterized Zn-finger protein